MDASRRAVTVDYGRGVGAEVTYTAAELDALLPAWAVTVHKAQGSEFPAVALLLHAGARMSRWEEMRCARHDV